MSEEDVTNGEFFQGYSPLNGPKDVLDKFLSNRIFKHNRDVRLIIEGDHFAGQIPWAVPKGALCNEIHWNEEIYLSEGFSYLKNGELHTIMTVRDVPDLPSTPDIPDPFDRWKKGGDKLPSNPHVQRNMEIA